MKKFTADLKAPRCRKSFKRTLTWDVVDMIQSEVFAAKYLEQEQIKNIIREFNNEIINTVINKRDGVEIPSQIGHLFIGTCSRAKHKNIDYQKTIKVGKPVQHLNWETDSNLAKIFFTTFASKYRFKNNELWGFNAVRGFKRQVAKTYPEKWNMYIQVDPRLKITSIFKSRLYSIERTEKDAENLKMYNEFEF